MKHAPDLGIRLESDDAPAGLLVTDLTVRYGDAIADNKVSFSICRGEIVALLGANGAGKSSLLNAISGVVTATGSVRAGGVSMDHLPPQERAHLVAQVPEGRRLFPSHTVRENLLLSAFSAAADERQSRLEETLHILPALGGLMDRRADLLSGGEQQMVALGRGLMSKAPILMIDELSLGLAPTVAQRFADTLLELKRLGYAILLVEQYVPLALQVADRVVLLDHGTVVLEGTPDEVRDEVMTLEDAYLGGGGQALEAAESEELLPERSTMKLPDRRLVAGAASFGTVLLVATLFLPWYEVMGTTVTTTLRGYDVPAQWIWPAFALAAASLAANLADLIFDKALPTTRVGQMALGSVAAVCGIASLALLFTRCWLLTGLPGPPFAMIQREWGLFLAIATAAPAVAGSGIALFGSRLVAPVPDRAVPDDAPDSANREDAVSVWENRR